MRAKTLREKYRKQNEGEDTQREREETEIDRMREDSEREI